MHAAVAAYLVLTAPMAVADEGQLLSGHRLLQSCAGIETGKPLAGTSAETRFLGYVQGVVNALDTLKARGTLACPSPTLTVKEFIHFYQSEARNFPTPWNPPRPT